MEKADDLERGQRVSRTLDKNMSRNCFEILITELLFRFILGGLAGTLPAHLATVAFREVGISLITLQEPRKVGYP
jgi:hypothetical protein